MLIEVQGLSKRYRPRGPMVVEEISFTIDRGETLAIFGDSGSGKSTIGQILAGIYPATAGELKRIAAAQSYTMLQPKGLQQRGRLNQRFFPGTGLILSNGLAKLVAHGIERIESIPASLRNIGDLFPPDPVELPLPAAQQLAAVEADRAGDPG